MQLLDSCVKNIQFLSCPVRVGLSRGSSYSFNRMLQHFLESHYSLPFDLLPLGWSNNVVHRVYYLNKLHNTNYQILKPVVSKDQGLECPVIA